MRCCGGGGRDQGNQVQSAALQGQRKSLRRFRRKVGDQDSGEARAGCILRQFFKAVAQQRIEIAEQHDGNSRCLGGAGCDFDDAVQLDAAGQGPLAGALNHRAVGRRIAERHAEFDGSGPAARHGDQEFVGGFEVGIAGRDVRAPRPCGLSRAEI